MNWVNYWASVITQKCQYCGKKLRRSKGIWTISSRKKGYLKFNRFILCVDCGKNKAIRKELLE